MPTYTRWYREGTISVTNNSNAITGSATYWLSAGLNPGDILKIDGTDYEILSIIDDTHLTIAGTYSGTTGKGKAYAIVRNFTASMSSRIAARTAELLGDFSKYIDTDMQSIHGKSAYQIACDKGFIGTESEWVQSLHGLNGASAYDVAVANGYDGTVNDWLDSLKAAQEWTDLRDRTAALEDLAAILGRDSAGLRNSIFRGINLGEFTSEHLASISAGTYKNMWVGDYFTMNGVQYVIMGVNCLSRYNASNATTARANIAVMPRTKLADTADYKAKFNVAAGELGEEDPGTVENPYPTSNWYVNVRPAYIEAMTALFGSLDEFSVSVPTNSSKSAWVYLRSAIHLPTMMHALGQPYYPVKDYFPLGTLHAVSMQLPYFALNPRGFPSTNPKSNHSGFYLAETDRVSLGRMEGFAYHNGWLSNWYLDTALNNLQGLHPLICVG